MQNLMFQLLLYRQKTMQNYQKYWAKDLKDQSAGPNKRRWWLHNWLVIGFCLFQKNNYRIIAADLSKEKALNADSRAIQQIIFKNDYL